MYMEQVHKEAIQKQEIQVIILMDMVHKETQFEYTTMSGVFVVDYLITKFLKNQIYQKEKYQVLLELNIHIRAVQLILMVIKYIIGLTGGMQQIVDGLDLMILDYK